MATPAERAVIAAARRQDGSQAGLARLGLALDALDAEQGGTGPAELEITWGQLVADDEMWSDKAGKWMTVLETKAVGTDTMVRLVGVGKPFQKPSTTPALVQRSAMGQAVDLFATVIWSGPNGG